MRSKTRAGILAGIALAVAVSIPAAAEARTLYGTTSDGKLVTFNDRQTKVKVKPTAKQIAAGTKAKTVNTVQVTARRNIFGLSAGVRIVGIDVRPVTGELYGIGTDSAMYKILITGDGTAVALFCGQLRRRRVEPGRHALRGGLQPRPGPHQGRQQLRPEPEAGPERNHRRQLGTAPRRDSGTAGGRRQP